MDSWALSACILLFHIITLEYVRGARTGCCSLRMLSKYPLLGIMISKKKDYFALLITVVVIKPLYFKDTTTGIIQKQFGWMFFNLCKPKQCFISPANTFPKRHTFHGCVFLARKKKSLSPPALLPHRPADIRKQLFLVLVKNRMKKKMSYVVCQKRSVTPNYTEVRILLKGKRPFPISFLQSLHTQSLSIYDLVLLISLVE